MQHIVGGDGWLQAIGAAWSTGVNAIGSAITGLFTSSPSAAVYSV
jgi:pyruvate/2-oxoacid:ferredoxin oxidoreductase beta subunit